MFSFILQFRDRNLNFQIVFDWVFNNYGFWYRHVHIILLNSFSLSLTHFSGCPTIAIIGSFVGAKLSTQTLYIFVGMGALIYYFHYSHRIMPYFLLTMSNFYLRVLWVSRNFSYLSYFEILFFIGGHGNSPSLGII